MRRRLKYSYEVQKSVHSLCNDISKNQDKLYDEMREIKDVLKKLACENELDSVDLQPFFPCNDSDTLLRFMSNNDGNYEKRRKSFESFLYSIVTSNNTKKRLFSDALFHNLFSRNFILNNLWPCKG